MSKINHERVNFKKRVESFDGYSESMSPAEIQKLSQKRKEEAWKLLGRVKRQKITSKFIQEVESQMNSGKYITQKQISYLKKCLKPKPEKTPDWVYDQAKIVNKFSCIEKFHDSMSKEDLEAVERLFDRFQKYRRLHSEDLWKLDSINSKYLLK